MTFEEWWDSKIEIGTPDTFRGWEESCRQAWVEGAKAEREACAMIADARAMRCEEKTATAEDDEVTELRSLAWQFSVLAAEMRKPSNA